MFSKLLRNDHPAEEFTHKEGDLYKIVNTFGKTFELRYGYYSESDRRYEPDVIYPDFIKEPMYTEEGTPFVTMMQDACPHYKGRAARTSDTTCAECHYFRHGEEWFGVCVCLPNKKNE